MRQKLNLITLGVKDITESARFFEEGLGWKRSEKSMEGLILYPLGGIVLSLHPRQELAEDATVVDEPTGFSGITLSINTKSEAEADAIMEEVRAAGGTIVKPAQKVFWGGYSGYFKDPSGHLFEVAYNPFWPLDEADNLAL